MRVVVQRVSKASVSVDNKIVGSIKEGFVVFVGFKQGDNEATISKMIKKISNLRIFEDDNGKMNLSILDKNFKILSISQFTLYANPYEGNRPSFTDALNPSEATILYDKFNNELESMNLLGGKGIFGAHMVIDQINDGPVTINIEY